MRETQVTTREGVGSSMRAKAHVFERLRLRPMWETKRGRERVRVKERERVCEREKERERERCKTRVTKEE